MGQFSVEISKPPGSLLSETQQKVLRQADTPPHGGFRGYVADPDDNAWEIAWNSAWSIDDRGLVTFGV